MFNSQGSDRLLSLARVGLRIYFIGFLFAGINIFCSSALSAIASVKWAFVLSILKGFVVVNVCAAILAPIFGMNGVWVAFPLSEFICNYFRVCDEKNQLVPWKVKDKICHKWQKGGTNEKI